MRYCSRCNSTISKNNKFCPECGAQIAEQENNTMDRKLSKKKILAVISITFLILVILIGAFSTSYNSNKKKNSNKETETTPPSIPFSDNPSAILAVSLSVVKLNCYDKMGKLYATGSGFACFENDVIVTNYHVIEGSIYEIDILTENGLSFEVSEVLAIDKNKDIAILLTSQKHNLELLSPGKSDCLQKGEKVVAIGSPLGLLNSVSDGVFSGYVENNGNTSLQFTAPISSGSSGGAIFNNAGEILGITYGSYENGQNLNLAVPIEQVIDLWNNQIINTNYSHRMSIQEYHDIQTPTYSVKYILENYHKLADADNVINDAFYIEGWVARHKNYRTDSWAYLYNTKKDIPYRSDPGITNEITIDELDHFRYSNIRIDWYDLNDELFETIKKIKTGNKIRVYVYVGYEMSEFGFNGVNLSGGSLEILN